MARRRSFSTFNLSFLDVMSCGFGAVILIFLVIHHGAETHNQEVNKELLAEVSLLEKEIREGQEQLATANSILADIDQQVVAAEGKAQTIRKEIQTHQQDAPPSDKDSLARTRHINQLKADVKNLEQKISELKGESFEQPGEQVRQFVGEGDRQYLTGLKLGGERILILLDSSASMLDRRVVNIIRMRNMSADKKRSSKKWQTALRTVEWLTAQLPRSSDYQIYTFNTDAKAVLPDTQGEWLPVMDDDQVEQAISQLGTVVPSGGTSLINLFKRIKELSPQPDNIYLITDGLPTLGQRPAGGNNISGKQRLDLFNKAIAELPTGIPVNIILEPLEGDPFAASAFWQLAQVTHGSFMSPAKDWP